LNPAYINYDSTHRAVSDAEKSSWNGKQNALSSTQLSAVDSGIDSLKVTQITTNTDSISEQRVALDEDRAALVEIVDSGAKNFLQNDATSQTISGVTFTVNADKSITLSGTARANITSFFICRAIPALTGNMVLSGCPAGGSSDTYRLDILDGTASGTVRFVDTGEGMDVDWSLITTGTYTTRIRIQSGTTVDGLIFKPMLCTKAAWDISHQYVPHRPSYDELIARIEALEGGV